MAKENIKINKVEAPTLFIGVGGTGCDIVTRVAEMCRPGETENISFVCLDTNVNDLSSVAKSHAHIYHVQTSNTQTVGDYLAYDQDALRNWFPKNAVIYDIFGLLPCGAGLHEKAHGHQREAAVFLHQNSKAVFKPIGLYAGYGFGHAGTRAEQAEQGQRTGIELSEKTYAHRDSPFSMLEWSNNLSSICGILPMIPPDV